MNTRKSGQIVTRFAPSPTGYLHIGGARTALFNWAFARRHEGIFILRMEDTDVARSTSESTRRILADLRWLGLSWDEGPDPSPAAGDPMQNQVGDFGPYFQSQRNDLYREYLERLRQAGRVYDDNGAVRFKMPEHDITVHDLVLGDVTIKREELKDFIIFKGEAAGGGPTFHFANVVDDATMQVTHVLRAQEHLMNTPKHLALFEALGIAPPHYAHMPLIFNPDGTKMSKRDKAKTARQAAKAKNLACPAGVDAASFAAFLDKKSDDNVLAAAIAGALGIPLPEIDCQDFRVSGYLKEVVLNYIALLGWNPGGNVDERFTLDWFVANFDLKGIGVSNAKFDRAKLLAFNAERLQQMPIGEFTELLRGHLRVHFPEYAELCDSALFVLFAQAYQPRTKVLSDPASAGRFFIQPDDAIVFDPKAVEKVLKKNNGAGLAVLRDLLPVLEAITDWQPAVLHAAVEKFTADKGLGMGDVAQPLRVALSGNTVSPPIDATLGILGKARTMARIRRCAAMAG